MAVLDDLRAWYQAQCDGDWEHAYGVVIQTMDNPGWLVRIDLRDTILEDQPFATVMSDDAGDGSWLVCKVEGKQFHGFGDPARLEEIIGRFVGWAKDRPDWLGVPDETALQQRDDRELWEHLGKDLGAERCRVDGCRHRRIRHSVYCRAHHWENVLGRASPFADTEDA